MSSVLGSLLIPLTSWKASSLRVVALVTSVTLVAWGLVSIGFRARALVLNLNLSLISVLVVSSLLGELLMRVGIALEVEFLRNPRLYAGPEDDEDQWKLRYLWQSETRSALRQVGLVVDPQLGWAPRKSADNPLGVHAAGPYTPDFTGQTALFYGDSFVHGVEPTAVDRRLPQQLGALLPGCSVYNYGVLGYGVDQIFLRFRETHGQFRDPVILVGLLTLDLDRSIFAVRDAPKPYFQIEGERLVLKGVPVPENTAQWYAEHPPHIRSYFVALLMRSYRLMAAGFRETESSYKQAEKKRINTRIIEAMVHEAETHRLRLLFVLLYPEWELHYQGWRETYLKELFGQLRIPYVDTKASLLRTARDSSGRLFQSPPGPAYYPPPNNHLNEFGNRIVAEAVAARLEGRCER